MRRLEHLRLSCSRSCGSYRGRSKRNWLALQRLARLRQDRGLARLAEPTWLTHDEVFASQFSALQQLTLTKREAGADMRSVADVIATHPFLKRWLERSDALVDELGGSKRLKARRRRGVLRHLDGPLRGVPFVQPPLNIYRSSDSPEPRAFALWDELEWLVIPGRFDDLGWRPTKDEINFDEARAWLGVKAATLYYHTWKRDIPGQKWRSARQNPDRSLREIRFDTESFHGWAAVSDLRGPRRCKSASWAGRLRRK